MSDADSQSLREKTARIRKHVRWYVLGCIGFILLACVCIWMGVLLFMGKDLPRPFILLAMGGIWLLGDMAKSWNYKSALPPSFVEITETEAPRLFGLVNSVTNNLGIKPLSRIYLCPDAFAAVFIRPSLKNVFKRRPKQELALGLGFLTQLSDKQLKTVLYHEFGHYVQESIRETCSVYRIGQFSKMFLADRKEYSGSSLTNQMKAQIALFANYTLVFVGQISDEYKELSELMEYEADDVAARHMGGALVKETLRKASTVKNAYEAIRWGLSLLPHKSFIDNAYESLNIISSREEYLFEVNEGCQRRIDRQSDSIVDNSPDSFLVQGEVKPWAIRFSSSMGGQQLPATDFAQWLSEGLPIYKRDSQLRGSVTIFIHLDPNKHRLPLLDSIYQILLDDRTIGRGNYKAGYELKIRTAPGKHTLSVYAPAGVKPCPFGFNVEADSAYRIDMDYELEKRNRNYHVFATGITQVDLHCK